MNFALTLEKADMLNQEKILNINSLLKKHAEFLNDEAHYTPDHNHGILDVYKRQHMVWAFCHPLLQAAAAVQAQNEIYKEIRE